MTLLDEESVASAVDAGSRHRPLVTVVMIFLNTQRYIAEAIDSVLAQRYQEWELMLVDDGSTDGSTEIARAYAQRYPERIHYIEHPQHENRGMSASRNAGVRHGRGSYVAFLDSDDVWLPQKLAEHVALLEGHPEAGWLAGGLIMWHSWARNGNGNGTDGAVDRMRELRIERDTVLQPPRHFCEFLGNGGALPGINSLLIRRSAIEAVGGSDERFRGAYEDQVLISKLSLNFPVYIASGCLDRYRQHPDSHTATVKRDGAYHPFLPHALRLPFLEWVDAYVRDQEISDQAVHDVVRAQLAPYRSRTTYAVTWLRQAISGARWTVRAALENRVRRIGRELVPTVLHAWGSRRVYGSDYRPPPGLIDFGSLRRVTPISADSGADRGVPVDRYYIEQLLTTYAADIRGHVLVVGDDDYARRVRGDRVTQLDVLHPTSGTMRATLPGDLADATELPTDRFDCVMLLHALQFSNDPRGCVRTFHHALKSGGVLLVTVPGVSPVRGERAQEWQSSFTTHSLTRLVSPCFPASHLRVHSYGNVLAAVALLHGAAAEELTSGELDAHDDEFQVIVAVRAVK